MAAILFEVKNVDSRVLRIGAKSLNENELLPLQKAQGLLFNRKPFDAMKIVNSLLKQEPDNGPAHVCRGMIFERLGQFEQAREALALAKNNGVATKVISDAKKRIKAISEKTNSAKTFLNSSKPEEALKALEKAQQIQSTSVAELLMVRAKLALGERDSARVLVDAFLAERPKHSLAQRLKQSIEDAAGESETKKQKRPQRKKTAITTSASKMAKPKAVAAVQAKKPAKKKVAPKAAAAPKGKKEPVRKAVTKTTLFEKRLGDRIMQLEAELPDNLSEILKHVRWINANAEKIEKRNWANELNFAKAAHFLFAINIEQAIKNYDANLISKSVEYGYITWPRRIQQFIRGGKVLDVGCGFGAFGNGFLLAGATDYVGIDPKMPLDSSTVKNKRKRERADLGITPREIMEKCPAIHLVNGIFEDLDTDDKFNSVALHNVTEHLENIRDIIPDIRHLLARDGYLVYHHHNFYCWNGHHMAPSRPENYRPGNGDQDKMVDWNHIVIAPDMAEDHYFNTNLNQIRLDEIKAVTKKYYDIEIWQEVESPVAVAKRLTDPVWEKLQSFDSTLTKRDLMVNAVLCVAKPK